MEITQHTREAEAWSERLRLRGRSQRFRLLVAVVGFSLVTCAAWALLRFGLF